MPIHGIGGDGDSTEHEGDETCFKLLKRKKITLSFKFPFISNVNTIENREPPFIFIIIIVSLFQN